MEDSWEQEIQEDWKEVLYQRRGMRDMRDLRCLRYLRDVRAMRCMRGWIHDSNNFDTLIDDGRHPRVVTIATWLIRQYEHISVIL
jgi:hypothetical protein